MSTPVRSVLALGSNLGERAGTLEQAVTDLVAHPADDFVASFLGVDTERELHVREVDGVELVVDAAGRPIGRLGGASPAKEAAR